MLSLKNIFFLCHDKRFLIDLEISFSLLMNFTSMDNLMCPMPYTFNGELDVSSGLKGYLYMYLRGFGEKKVDNIDLGVFFSNNV